MQKVGVPNATKNKISLHPTNDRCGNRMEEKLTSANIEQHEKIYIDCIARRLIELFCGSVSALSTTFLLFSRGFLLCPKAFVTKPMGTSIVLNANN